MPNQTERKKIIKLIRKKPIIADVDELNTNPPSRSAKLRYGIKINDTNDFKDFKKKFQFLLDIEGLAEKL